MLPSWKSPLSIRLHLLTVVPRFQLSHIQNIVHQRQKQLRGQLDFMQTIAYARVVVLIFSDDSQHADDAVDGCADIVRHVVQECCFGGVGSLACVSAPAALSGSAAA